MKDLAGKVVLVTGASGGLGWHITETLAHVGARLALVAYPGAELQALRDKVSRNGVSALSFTYDLRYPVQRKEVLQRVRQELGRIDVLINNAGVEFTAPFHELSDANVRDILSVNLEAAIFLSKHVLPEMVQARSGHIVNMSSLAGRASPAFQEVYAATKAGLVAFTFSLRASYRAQGVSASAIVPGFVEAGIYAKLKERSHCTAPAILGTSQPQAVARAVLRAIYNDLPEVMVNPRPVRPLLALTAMFPRVGEFVTRLTGGHEFFRKVVEATRNQ